MSEWYQKKIYLVHQDGSVTVFVNGKKVEGAATPDYSPLHSQANGVIDGKGVFLLNFSLKDGPVLQSIGFAAQDEWVKALTERMVFLPDSYCIVLDEGVYNPGVHKMYPTKEERKLI